MTDNSVSQFMTFAQLDYFLAKLQRQTKTHEKLIALSCEMFQELYRRKPDSPLVKRWHETARELMGG